MVSVVKSDVTEPLQPRPIASQPPNFMNAAAKGKPPSMWRRMALVIALAALVGLVAASWIRVHEVVADRNNILTERLDGTAQNLSRELSGRLELADAQARYLTATDGGAGGTLLRERLLSNDAF